MKHITKVLFVVGFSGALIITKVTAQVCTPTVVGYDAATPGITNVTFNTINRTSAAFEFPPSNGNYPGGNNYISTGISTSVARGQSYNFSMTFNSDFCLQMNLRVWIDWNANGSFDDAGELVVTQDYKADGTYSNAITVPSSAALGSITMRVADKMVANCGHTAPTSCNNPPDPLDWHGSIEDYLLNIGTSGVDEYSKDLFEWNVFPNPFQNTATISYVLNEKSNVSVKIYDVLGQVVDVIADNEVHNSGNYSYNFNSATSHKGIYFVRLTVGNREYTKRLIGIE